MAVDRECAGVDAKHLHRVRDEPLEPIETFIDDRDELAFARGWGGVPQPGHSRRLWSP